MNEKLKTTLAVLAYGFLCGLLLSLFSMIDGFFRYAFSLGALFLGIHFFKNNEGLGSRIAFIATSIVMYFLITVIITLVLYAQGKLTLPETG